MSMNAVDVLAQRDAQYKRDLEKIGSAIGYGRAQQLLGELWDAKLRAEYDITPGRGAMGVTIDDDLPPMPKAANKRRKQGAHGGYCMVPAYTEGVSVQCELCGGLVTWRGHLSALTHTECENCGGQNCQIAEAVADDTDDPQSETFVGHDVECGGW